MPLFFIVITEDKGPCICTLIPSLHHESSADCERGRKVILLKRGVCVAVVLVGFPIIVQREVKSLQSGTEWNWAVLILNFWISGIAPQPVSISNGIPTEVVISHIGEWVIMRCCVRPSLTRDPFTSGVCFSNLVTA